MRSEGRRAVGRTGTSATRTCTGIARGRGYAPRRDGPPARRRPARAGRSRRSSCSRRTPSALQPRSTSRAPRVEPEGDVILVDVAARGGERHRRRPQGARDPRGRLDLDRADRASSSRSAPTRPSGARRARPADAVVWEEVEARTSEESRLSATFLLFMVLAALIAAVGIFLDSRDPRRRRDGRRPGVRPDRRRSASPSSSGAASSPLRSLGALAVGFPLAIAAVWLAQRRLQGDRRRRPTTFSDADHSLADLDLQPGLLRVLRRVLRGRRRDAQPQHREVRRAHRRAHLGHDDPRRRERRRRRSPTRTGTAWRGSLAAARASTSRRSSSPGR